MGCLLGISSMTAQETIERSVQLTVQDGVYDGLKERIEQSTTKLLTEINQAFMENRRDRKSVV